MNERKGEKYDMIVEYYRVENDTLVTKAASGRYSLGHCS
jgi:hypothetical protein